MKIAALIVTALAVAGVQACASSPPEQDLPNAATFRRGEAIEFYDFRLGVSHAGARDGVRGRDCSTDDFHCYRGVSVLIAPRRCAALRRLVRSRADWRVEEGVSARLSFVSEQQLYFASEVAAGFVYDIERGVIGVWRAEAARRPALDPTAMREIVDSTKWLERPTTLFACS